MVVPLEGMFGNVCAHRAGILTWTRKYRSHKQQDLQAPTEYLVQVNKLDWIVFNVALFCTMFAGVDIGLGISIGVSVVLALYKSAFPKTSILGRLPDTTVYRCAI